MENHILQWLNVIAAFAGPFAVIWVSLKNRKLNIAQVAESHAVMQSVGDTARVIEAKVEQVVGKVADVGSQVDTVGESVNGRFSQSQEITKQVLDHVMTIDVTAIEKAADVAATKIVETAAATAEELAKMTAEKLAEAAVRIREGNGQ